MSGVWLRPNVSGSDHPNRDAGSQPAIAVLYADIRRGWARLRERWILGVPWGTVVLGAILGLVFVVLQDAGGQQKPLVIRFTSWSYHDPVGVLLSPLAHSSTDHLLGNLVGLLVFGSIAEYIFDHKRPAGGDSPHFVNHPGVRAGLLFPGCAILAGLLASIGSWGPMIGFSPVIFAFAGIALVRYPLATIVALAVTKALEVVLRAGLRPFETATRSPATDPWFVDVAIQGHVFGLVLGIVGGVLLVLHRDWELPPLRRLWLGIAVFAMAQSFWVLWWPRETYYVLARGLGVIFVGTLALVLTGGAVLAVRGVDSMEPATAKRVGIVGLLLPLALMAGIAVPLNATADVTAPAGSETVTIDGYDVTYAEDVPNQQLAPFAAVAVDDPPTTSGVIVAQPDRGVWTRVVAAERLANGGSVSTRLGGIGWDRQVFTLRRVWHTLGNESASQVWIHPKDGRLHRVYWSDPATAEASFGNYTIRILPEGIRFQVQVMRDNETIGSDPVPFQNNSVTFGDLEIHGKADKLVASHNGTRVPIAWRGERS